MFIPRFSDSRRVCLELLGGLALALMIPANARADEIPTIGRPAGRPRIVIDRLTFPEAVSGAPHYARFLQKALLREGRRMDWGTGRSSTISVRFVVEELVLTPMGSALRVSCSARGELPRRRKARSRIVYSGDPKQPRALVERVLGIVARGVMTRLSDLERSRRRAQ